MYVSRTVYTWVYTRARVSLCVRVCCSSKYRPFLKQSIHLMLTTTYIYIRSSLSLYDTRIFRVCTVCTQLYIFVCGITLYFFAVAFSLSRSWLLLLLLSILSFCRCFVRWIRFPFFRRRETHYIILVRFISDNTTFLFYLLRSLVTGKVRAQEQNDSIQCG